MDIPAHSPYPATMNNHPKIPVSMAPGRRTVLRTREPLRIDRIRFRRRARIFQ